MTTRWIVLALLATTSGGGQSQPPKELADYETWPAVLKEPREVPWNLAIMCSVPSPAMWKEAEKKYGPHVRRFIRVTGNSSAVAALAVPKEKRRFPAGASIAKAKFITSAYGTADGVGFMTKRDSPEFKDTGGWEFSYFPNGGEPRKTHQACASCHRSAASTDFIFGHYEP